MSEEITSSGVNSRAARVVLPEPAAPTRTTRDGPPTRRTSSSRVSAASGDASADGRTSPGDDPARPAPGDADELLGCLIRLIGIFIAADDRRRLGSRDTLGDLFQPVVGTP